MTEEPLSHNGVRRVYRALCNLAWCDGEFDPREQDYLQGYRERFEIGPEEARALEEEGRQGLHLGVSKRPAEQALLATGMIEVTMADGVLTTEEQAKLVAFGKTLGLSQEMIARRIREWAEQQGKRLEAGG